MVLRRYTASESPSKGWMVALIQTTMVFGWDFKATFKNLSVNNGHLTVAIIAFRKFLLVVNIIDG